MALEIYICGNADLWPWSAPTKNKPFPNSISRAGTWGIGYIRLWNVGVNYEIGWISEWISRGVGVGGGEAHWAVGVDGGLAA